MSKPNLPPVPDRIYMMADVWNKAELDAAIQAYAEEAVRQALEHAAQSLEHMAQEEFERPGFSYPTHLAYHQAVQHIRAIMPASSRHKPAPVDTSSEHSAAVSGYAQPVAWQYFSIVDQDWCGCDPERVEALKKSGMRVRPLFASPQASEYTSAMGDAAQAYMDSFPFAHKLPAQFRWADLWNAMLSAANQASNKET